MDHINAVTKDPGWVAHFLMRALGQRPITLYGDGRQVCDVLFVQDLVDALHLAQQHMPALTGQVFNIGGGPTNTTSLLELIDLIGAVHSKKPCVQFATWRPGDQKYYVSDTRKFRRATGWEPQVGVQKGVEALYAGYVRSTVTQWPPTPLATLWQRQEWESHHDD